MPDAAFEAKTVAQLAREIGNERQSVQPVTDQLERDSMLSIETGGSPKDGRSPDAVRSMARTGLRSDTSFFFAQTHCASDRKRRDELVIDIAADQPTIETIAERLRQLAT